MKKRELILDFTSLLDVIMILLFVVISNMSLVSANANAAAKEETEAAKEALAAEQFQTEEAAEKIREAPKPKTKKTSTKVLESQISFDF